MQLKTRRREIRVISQEKALFTLFFLVTPEPRALGTHGKDSIIEVFKILSSILTLF